MPRRKKPVTINLADEVLNRLNELTQQMSMNRGQVIAWLIMDANPKIVNSRRSSQETTNE